MIKKNRWLVSIIILALLLLGTAGCRDQSKPEDTGPPSAPPGAALPAEKPPAEAPPANVTGPDQSDANKVVAAFIQALRTADLSTLRHICRFSDQAQNPEKVLQAYGEYISEIAAEEVVIVEADLGPEIDGVFFVGVKDDPGLILLAVQVEQIEKKYYVVIVTDDPEYEF